MKIIVIGGGAAGFFSALCAKEHDPKSQVIIVERSEKLLQKVRISGGGRCNVTHACFEPHLLVQNYPRGHKELLGPFHRFQPRDTIQWFKNRGVILHQEEDGRMFPSTNSSSTITDCFVREAKKLEIDVRTQTKLENIQKGEKGFILQFPHGELFADRVILATGSARLGWEIAKNLGHTIQEPVPSLFTFSVSPFPLKELSGMSVNPVNLRIANSKSEQSGSLLITHKGFSGPATLKLSAFAARILAKKKYNFSLVVDWLPLISLEKLRYLIEEEKSLYPARQLGKLKMLSLPKNFLLNLYERCNLLLNLPINSLSKNAISHLCERIKKDVYQVSGKTTNKEEFVTCGGVTLSEVDCKKMESRSCPNLFFCGEVLDIDGITGGFNFQNAWTTGWIAGKAAAS